MTPLLSALHARSRILMMLLALLGAVGLGLPPVQGAEEDDSWTSSDKALHYWVSFGLDTVGYWTARGACHWSPLTSQLAAGTATLSLGVAKEMTDDTFDTKDLAWDTAGVLTSALLWALVDPATARPPVQVAFSPNSGCLYWTHPF